jgi:hypothetical protein
MQEIKRQGFWKPEATAAYLGLKERTLANWRLMGKGPRFHKLHGACRYLAADVIQWAESRPGGGQEAVTNGA